MSDATENPYRPPESEQRPPSSRGVGPRHTFGRLALSLAFMLAIGALSGLAQLAGLAGHRNWGMAPVVIVMAGLTVWLVRLGRREWNATEP